MIALIIFSSICTAVYFFLRLNLKKLQEANRPSLTPDQLMYLNPYEVAYLLHGIRFTIKMILSSLLAEKRISSNLKKDKLRVNKKLLCDPSILVPNYRKVYAFLSHMPLGVPESHLVWNIYDSITLQSSLIKDFENLTKDMIDKNILVNIPKKNDNKFLVFTCVLLVVLSAIVCIAVFNISSSVILWFIVLILIIFFSLLLTIDFRKRHLNSSKEFVLSYKKLIKSRYVTEENYNAKLFDLALLGEKGLSKYRLKFLMD